MHIKVFGKVHLFIFMMIFTLLFSGCSKDSSSAANDPSNESDKRENLSAEESQAPKPPANMETILSYLPGEFSGSTYDEQKDIIEETLATFPDISNETDDQAVENIWATLVSLFFEEYPHPDNVIARWKEEGMELEEKDEAENMSVVMDRETTVFDYKYEWGDLTSLQVRNLDKALWFLLENDNISTDQRKQMLNYRHDLHDILNNAENKVYKDLLSLTKENDEAIAKFMKENYH